MNEDGFRQPAPDFTSFARLYEAGRAQVVYRRVAGDLDTPVSAYLKLAGDRKDSFLLESVEGGENLGRYSTIGLDPDLIWRANGDQPEINNAPAIDPDRFKPTDGGAIYSLQRVIAQSQIDLDPSIQHKLPPMAAGMFGYFGYDFVRLTEHLPHRPPSAYSVPDGYFVRPTLLAIFDNVKREVILITPVRPDPLIDAQRAYTIATDRLADALIRLETPLIVPMPHTDNVTEFSANITPEKFKQNAVKAKEYIAAGDIFQVVLSQRFTAPFSGDPFNIYRQLRRVNPSPFLFFLNFRPAALLGASPEILVRVRDKKVTIRPIAGTRRRGVSKEEDLQLEAELLADPKERAEHLMLLDLGRNDVGRSTKIGSVVPTATYTIERYSHVMHIVSNVEGQLRDEVHPLQALANGFPAGTLTGAPKVRAMQIIDELEPEGRGPYGGCIGYFGADGAVDTCIGLRMAVVTNDMVHVQAGAGIVADSDPEAEHQECLVKAAAIKEAVRRASLGQSGHQSSA